MLRFELFMASQMTKRTLFLTDQQWAALEAISKDTGASVSWQVRQAIEAYLESKKKSKK